MTVKFRVEFDITGETLFALVAKMLPIENVSVEELRPTVANRLSTAPRLVAHKPKPQKNKRASRGPDLNKGVNKVIVTTLQEKPMRPIEIQPKVLAAGFSKDSLTSRLEFLASHGIVERVGDGTWRLKSEA